jgi:hypothetical protein
MKNYFLISVLIFLVINSAFSQKKPLVNEFKADHQYLLFPVDENAPMQELIFNATDFETYFSITLASHKDSVDFWVFMDIERFKDEKVSLHGYKSDEIKSAFKIIFTDD